MSLKETNELLEETNEPAPQHLPLEWKKEKTGTRGVRRRMPRKEKRNEVEGPPEDIL